MHHLLKHCVDPLDQAPLPGSYQYSDRTLTAGIARYGSFYQVPDWLYFRRDHEQPSATGVSISSIDASMPRRERKVP